MDAKTSLPLIQDSRNPITPNGGVIFTYGLEASYLSPGTGWKAVSQYVSNDLLDPVRHSGATWLRGKDAVAVQFIEYDSAAAAGIGLSEMLEQNQLEGVTEGPTDIGEISFVQPSSELPMIYFVRSNCVVAVSSAGSSDTVIAAASNIDAGIIAYPQKASTSSLRVSVTETGTRSFSVSFDPAQPSTGHFYKFIAGGAQMALENTILLAVLLSDITDTQFRIFDVDGSDAASATQSSLYDLDSTASAG